MKKDIPQLKVTDLAIAMAPRLDTLASGEDNMWDVFVLNEYDGPIRNVLISSRGYGMLDGEERRTTTLRHYYVEIAPNTITQIEPIQTKLFELTHEYWVSFQYGDYMYDKRYTFVPGSTQAELFTHIPVLNRPGVMIR